MSRRTSYFAAWPLAVLLVAMTGCGSSTQDLTGPAVDTVAPTVTAIKFLNAATGPAITASFSEAMNASTITTATFTLEGPGATPVAGTVSYNASTEMASFTPITALTPGTAYVATITTGAQDVAGNALVGRQLGQAIWFFSNQAVALGGAGAFAVLAGSTITNTGATGLTGDMGVSPGTAVTGFPPGTLTGTLHAGDPASAAAIADLTTAYNDAAGRTLAPVAVAGNLGGMTLPPGLYKSTSSLEVSSGDLTLDARGDANAVFIFQMASTLTTTSGRAVVLIGGAKASNVFWQVGSSATLGTTSAFKGTIMADQSITLNAGATLDGRALARIGAVTLDANAVVVPTS